MKNYVSVFVLFFVLAGFARSQEIRIHGEKFPVRLNVLSWKTGKQTELLRPGPLFGPGTYTVSTEALSTAAYQVLVRYAVNEEDPAEPTLGSKVFVLKDKDVIHVHYVDIIPPPNATTISYRGGEILLTAMWPFAERNPRDFKGREEFRSTALFLAKYGEKEVAKRLATYVVANLKDSSKTRYGMCRDTQQLAVTFHVTATGEVDPRQAASSVEELAAAIQKGFWYMFNSKRLPNGGTLWSEMQKAKGLLQEIEFQKKAEEERNEPFP